MPWTLLEGSAAVFMPGTGSPAFFLLHYLDETTRCTVIACLLARGGPFVILAPSFILAGNCLGSADKSSAY